jgi:large subunit ribosomal protein L10
VNKEQKAAFVDDVAGRVAESEAIFAIDYRGVSVSQVAELRGKLREADASFQVVKNTLTKIALDKADVPGGTDLQEFLSGPTAFTYVKGDIAMAAKAIADFKKEYELLEFKGGVMEGQIISVDQFQALTKLPSRDVLNGQLVGMLASPITGVVRSLNGLISGLAIQLSQIAEQGLVGGNAPAPAAEEAPAAEADEAPEAEAAEETPAAEADGAEETAEEAAPEADASEEAPAEDAPAEESDAEEDATSDDAE